MPDFYDILGVSQDADDNEIKKSQIIRRIIKLFYLTPTTNS